MVKKKKQQLITAFSFVFVYWEYHAENAGDGISEALNSKIFWVSMPPDYPHPPRIGAPSSSFFLLSLRSPSKAHAADYRYPIAYEINA